MNIRCAKNLNENQYHRIMPMKKKNLPVHKECERGLAERVRHNTLSRKMLHTVIAMVIETSLRRKRNISIRDIRSPLEQFHSPRDLVGHIEITKVPYHIEPICPNHQTGMEEIHGPISIRSINDTEGTLVVRFEAHHTTAT